ncbi:tail completion protein gp17 [Parabacteroides sp.]
MSLLIGKHIHSVLTSDDDVKGLVKGRVFPLVIPEGTDRPFVVFNDINVVGEYTKDGWIGDTTQVTVMCVADKYESAADLAENVRITLEQSKKHYDSYTIGGGELKKSADAYENGVYVIVLNFEFETF